MTLTARLTHQLGGWSPLACGGGLLRGVPPSAWIADTSTAAPLFLDPTVAMATLATRLASRVGGRGSCSISVRLNDSTVSFSSELLQQLADPLDLCRVLVPYLLPLLRSDLHRLLGIVDDKATNFDGVADSFRGVLGEAVCLARTTDERLIHPLLEDPVAFRTTLLIC